ncbi:class I SAM-dependent methyltransferase [Nocardioides sp. Kera G14]|uniref:class I SAM-dependent methyltransferase n=1 Tax=Nocardioides sp. Kera G14 TaxID=2884264 RepID=UPI001D120845|nr:class I SAM-dependent methyltransferase [Nocardioides sp. Kera G14]UDY23800.1 class I SAM-dependent methyltransferase [Nocardioides sp. Kera G14]
MADPARSFGSVADAYDHGRPDYPADAVTWLVGRPGTEFVSVLELGAGTGKLTRALVEQRYHVFATDPDDAMLDRLSAHLPDVRATKAVAEQLPVPDQSVDVVMAAQAFHWFDLERALPEIARVLRSGGHLALAWNEFDRSIPWVRKFATIIGNTAHDDPSELLEESGYFAGTLHETFNFWHEVDKEMLVSLALSRSAQATATDEDRAAVRSQVESLYNDYGRGTGGMRLPYICHAYRAAVTEKRPVTPPMPTTLISSSAPQPVEEEPDNTAVALPRVLTGYDDPDTGEVKLFTWH